MKSITRLNNQLRYFLMTALVLMSVSPSRASAQTGHSQMSTEEMQLTLEQKTARATPTVRL
jgi:hypothetical protein